MKVKISVIIPVYNAEKYLEECLESVIKQTIKDIEIICVDDGSTDQSRTILMNYAKQDSRIVVLQQENKGAGIARNRALDKATGQYVAFMDSDDSYPENIILEHLYNAAQEHDAMIVGGYCNIKHMDLNYEEPKKEDPIVEICKSNPEGTFVEYRDFQYDFNYQGYIYNHKFLADNAIKFPTYRRYQDPPFFVKAMICAEKFWVIPECTYCYKYGQQNIKWNAEKINDMLCGHIDNLLISKKYQLGILHKNTVAHLEYRYKELLTNQLEMTNLRLYALGVYANSIVDYSLLEKTTNKKRKIHRMQLLDAFDDKLIKLLNCSEEQLSYENRLEALISMLLQEYRSIDKKSEIPVAEDIICLLGRMLQENRPYDVRRAVYRFQQKELYNWLIKETDKIEEMNQTVQHSLQKLKSLPGAFAFMEKMQRSNQDRKCKCIYKASNRNIPMVSVIIPVYNVEEYLRDCLDSVVEQSLKEIEIICVDDGSTDGSFAILQEYAKKNQNITVLQQENGGLSVARNNGMLYANGKYIHFLDSDDSMETDAYEKLTEYAETNQLELLFFNGKSFYETKELENEYPWYKNGYSTDETKLPVCATGEEYFQRAVLSDNFKMHAGMYIAKRQYVEDHHLNFINGILHEDNYYTIKITLLAGKTGLFGEPLYNRRIRRGSLTIVPLDFRHVYGYFISCIRLYELIEENKYSGVTAEAFWLKFRQIVHNGMASYMKIENAYQKYFYLALPTKEMVIFYALFIENQRQLTDVKETMKETKRILQRTYDEKFDRGVEIKQLKKELAETRKELTKTQKKLTGITHSITYRAARIIGSPIRMIRKLLRRTKEQ